MLADRAFFGNASDARVILEDLAEKTRVNGPRRGRLKERENRIALCPPSFKVATAQADSMICLSPASVSASRKILIGRPKRGTFSAAPSARYTPKHRSGRQC